MECATSRVNPKVNYGFWLIVMCNYRFVIYNKGITLVKELDGGGGCGRAGHVGVVFSTQLCWEPKTVLKKKVY